jgi:hypothetical protein
VRRRGRGVNLKINGRNKKGKEELKVGSDMKVKEE